MGWFNKKEEKKSLPDYPIAYPSGVCVKTESGYWYINGKYKHPLTHPRVLDTWSFPLIVDSTDAALVKFIKAKPLGFRDGTIIRTVSNGHMYLISQRKRRRITSPEALRILGHGPFDGLLVSDADLTLHEEGDVIS